jgi:hypothetical protein
MCGDGYKEYDYHEEQLQQHLFTSDVCFPILHSVTVDSLLTLIHGGSVLGIKIKSTVKILPPLVFSLTLVPTNLGPKATKLDMEFTKFARIIRH